MAWQTPKTDWHGSTNSEGVYTGDRFNASDLPYQEQSDVPPGYGNQAVQGVLPCKSG